MAHTIRLLASRAPQQARRRDRVTPLAPVYRLPSSLPVASPRYHTGAKDTLEVKEAPGAGKVFAIGDCTDLAVPKLGVLAGMEGMSVTKQIKASAAGTPLKSRKPPVVPISIVPVGKSGGVSYLPIGVVVGDFATKKIKSENVFLSKYWSDLRARKPPVV